MSLSSPPCYLDLLVSEADWSGPKGAAQSASIDGWTLGVEPQAGVGWRWWLRNDADATRAAEAEGVVRFGEVADPEPEAKTRAADAWTFSAHETNS
jgi:hypothetical protein